MAKVWQSDRVKLIPEADIRQMTLECQKVGGINLSQGVCDLPTPPEILKAASDAVMADKSVYAPAAGIPELRQAILKKVRNQNKISCELEQIIVTNGVTGGFTAVLTGLFNPGDGLMLLEPFYGYHYNDAVLAGLKVVAVPLAAPTFQITREALETAYDKTVKAMVLCSPSNPSGRVFTQAELDVAVSFCRDHGLVLISDEIYEYFTYGSAQHLSPAALYPQADFIVSMMGFSKTFSITGWRLGYLVLPKSMVASVAKANDLLYVCAPTPLQYGVLAGLEKVSATYYSEMQLSFSTKREKLCSALEKAGLQPIWPDGSYYVLANIESLRCATSIEAAQLILAKYKVASVPGRAFFLSHNNDKYVRFCFAIEDSLLDQACRNLTDRYSED